MSVWDSWLVLATAWAVALTLVIGFAEWLDRVECRQEEKLWRDRPVCERCGHHVYDQRTHDALVHRRGGAW